MLFNKTFFTSAILLAFSKAVFAAENDGEPVRYVKANQLEVTKRNVFGLMFEPHYVAMPLNAHADSLIKRQSCAIGSTKCYEGCCKIGTVCGIYGGEKGCCQIGKRCGSVSGCSDPTEVFCTDYCCPAGSTCAKDPVTGKSGCNTGNTDTGNGCDAGYSPCTLFKGCCPTGTQCMLPKNCNIPCTAADPVCGDGCCQKGSICTPDLTCAKDDSNNFTTLKPSTSVVVTRTLPAPSTVVTEPEVTETTTTDDFLGGYPTTTTTPARSSTTSTTSTTTTRRTIIQVSTQNAAPTMGAVFAGGLGMAAGVLGALAI